ncbi:hypothetical protein RA178_20125 [Shewanella oncorhynchi]|uniref:Uncharacterized protein n=1 Tax=Shewanella oncorhynchi TaxID=2726434 RepID=A0AA50KCP6_9GAMM|nr:hypothetical protein [Shewanella oncorhynchi]WMB72688.1 hypothetical protein RA178_20125 [Shewanella oncorhynchi]
MQQLASYILAIEGYPSPVYVVSQSNKQQTYHDDNVEICESITLYHFDNGVVISKLSEQDKQAYESDMVCEDYWLSYRVVTAHIAISPQQKSFSNLCQQSFWLKMQQGLAVKPPLQPEHKQN